jgi:hypothetical protein
MNMDLIQQPAEGDDAKPSFCGRRSWASGRRPSQMAVAASSGSCLTARLLHSVAWIYRAEQHI